ncbi:MAG TPA: tripartite tricarboxylate transporter substrate binding protein [Casimicrobiaceae bacterium]|nr:tripartite tricarboxylate transporter substrate binding protein [Casimicrobiaceae bacterium]
MNRIRRSLCVIALTVTAFASPPVVAQDNYPDKPIRLILGFAPGGISDVLGRALAAELSPILGQQVVVENRPGAGGSIAAAMVAKSPNDGYTVWLQDMTSHAINAALYTNLNYDPIKDFEPITLVAYTPLMLAVHPSQPTKTVKELVEYLKNTPGRRTYGSAGNGTPNHLAAEMLNQSAGLKDVVHVPFKGSSPTVTALLANEMAYSFLSMPPAVSNVQGGKLRGLAVTSATRVSAAPDVPTMIEAGYPGFEVVVYTGILAPAGTPKAIIDKLGAAFTKAVQAERIKDVYLKIGAEAVTNTPAAFRAHMVKEIDHYAKLVKASGAKVD